MSEIKVVHQIESSKAEALGVFDWPVWNKEISTFDWHYDSAESCYFLAGEVLVTPQNGEPVSMGKGDLVIFPAGMSCRWQIKSAVKKHYRFD